MAILIEGAVPRLDIELAAACDHRCGHCYNVWGAKPGDPQAGYDTKGQLATADLKALITKAVSQSGATQLTLTGGEPLLRKDALELVELACSLAPSVSIITNGSHVPPAVAKRLAELRIHSVQLTLLAGDRALHDLLKGAVCFDDTVRAGLDLVEAGVLVQCCFVAMSKNHGELRRVLELCAALGIRHLSYNRMAPTGGAIHHVERLLPSAEQIEADLHVAQTVGKDLGIRIATAMPIPPCLVRMERYPWVQTGVCSTGSESPNLVLDAKGNVRSCNLSSEILGNLLEQDWREIMANPYPQRFKQNVPTICQGCAFERSCQGGCKESAFAVFGDHQHIEPLLHAALSEA